MSDEPFGCWEWTGIMINGRAYLYQSERPHLVRVTRWLYARMHDPIPDKGVIMHTCDRPPCVNLGHLVLGTQADNMRDMIAKGRALIGVRNPNAKLTEDDVIEMRALRIEGWKLADLAARYGIDFASVGNICRRKSWTHI